MQKPQLTLSAGSRAQGPEKPAHSVGAPPRQRRPQNALEKVVTKRTLQQDFKSCFGREERRD